MLFRSADNDMAIRNTNVNRFVITLTDDGIGIDNATASLTSMYTLTSDGNLLSDGVQYVFVYDSNAHQAIFAPTNGVWDQNHTYQITLNNSVTGIRDLAGNPVLSNRPSGATQFNVFVGILYDFGDAPDPTYPTLLASNGAAHVVIDGFHLGATVTEESAAFQSANADGDKNPDGTSSDDGIQFVSVSPNVNSQMTNEILLQSPKNLSRNNHLAIGMQARRQAKQSVLSSLLQVE